MNRLPQLTLYPNPTSNFIQLKNIRADEVQEVQIAGIDGKMVLAFKTTGLMQYNISNLPGGMYLLKLIKKDNTVSVIQFNKQ